ncbi:PAS domain S-box protein, partial [Arcobacteraceae bacterium]|nr:PAS domain S-box protein [Arcobacteraceae bacterium]
MYKKDQSIFKTVFDLSPDPILIIKENKFIDCNQAAVDIIGAHSKDELIKIHPSRISPIKQPDGINSHDKANDMIANADKEGVSRFEWLHIKIDGSKLYVEVTLTKFNTAEGELIHVHWKDISEKYIHLKIIKDTHIDYEALLETTLDGYWVVNSTGDITEVNEAYCNMSGYSKEELLKMKISDLEVVESPEETKKHIETIISKGTDLFETTHRRKDGSLIYFEVSVTFVNENGGKFIALLRNITKQKKLIKKLIQNKENLKQAQRLAQIGHWELNLIKNKLYWSDEVYRIFGLEPQEFNATYEAFLQYVHPEDHILVNDTYAKSVENITSYEIIHRVVTKQGNIKYVEERCNHEVDSNGKVIKSIGTVHDITQRVSYEKDLQLASSVFEYSSDAILISDENNKIVTVNNAFENLTGYSLDEIKGKNPRVISSGWGDKEFYSKMWSDISNKGIWLGEIWDRKKSGTLYAASQSIIAVKDKERKLLNYIGISHDITESKENEKKIKQLAYFD